MLSGLEFTHVAQRRAGRVQPILWNETPLNAESSLEGEADVAGKEAAQGKTVDVGGTNAHLQHAQSEAPIQMKKVSQEEAERQLRLSLMGSTLPRTAGDEAGSADLERGLKLPPGYLRHYGLQPGPE